MLSNSITLILLLSIAFTSSFAFWETFKKKEDLVKIYKKCESGKEQVVCRGIFGTDCLGKKNCDYINLVTETDDAIEFESRDLDDLTYQERPKPLVYMIGFSPFETDHGNVTAKCKSKITRDDFKFFIYNPGGDPKSSITTNNDRLSWNAGESALSGGSMINKTIWERSCRENLKERNFITDQYKGRPITEYQNAVMVAKGEFVVILQAKYNQHYTNRQKLEFREMTQYKWSDGILFTNFENKDLPEHEQRYKVPDSEFSSSTMTKASFLATLMTFLFAILAVKM